MSLPKPYNSLVNPMLTDMYQITMAYSYWQQQKSNDIVVFDLFARKAPFKGEFIIYAGLNDCLSFIQHFQFSKEDIDYIKTIMPDTTEDGFYDYLLSLNTTNITVRSLPEGTISFPKIPFMIIEGPLGIVQLLETTLLNIVNFATLMATNACRHCQATDEGVNMIEFGTRRAQGPDGSLAAAKYSFIGGFHGTSNVLAGKLFGIPVVGTHAHSYVMSFTSWNDIHNPILKIGDTIYDTNFVDTIKATETEYYTTMELLSTTNTSELVAFTSYAIAFPTNFLALIDTYGVLKSGVHNFAIVAIALERYNIKAKGIRLDSGDLAYQSKEVRTIMLNVASKFNLPHLGQINIVVSSDISESVLRSIKMQPHSIDSYGVGTNLVTCKGQPALGGVYKLVDINGSPTIKLSETMGKITIPAKKRCFRLYNSNNKAMDDIMIIADEEPPKVGKLCMCRDPFNEGRRVNIIPSKVEELHQIYWKDGKMQQYIPSLSDIRNRVINGIKDTRQDHIRAENPTPYKVSVSPKLYSLIHDLWQEVRPIETIS